MRWQGKEQSKNVEDRRGERSSRGGSIGVGGGLGIGVLLLAGLIFLLGGDPSGFLQQAQRQQVPQQQTQQRTDGQSTYVGTEQEEALADIAGVVLKETEDVWGSIFPNQLGKRYVPARLVLFEQSIASACGMAGSATGPFYCPGDNKIYLDVDFYDQLKRKFGAPGDFAFAYVVAHEVGHHVQNQLGYTSYVHNQKNRVSQAAYNDLSVRLELQADFLAGVWAHHTYKNTDLIEDDDFQEAMRAAEAIGDDNIQRQTQGYIRPETFTHGTSEQRMRWFRYGLETGDISKGDTFNARRL